MRRYLLIAVAGLLSLRVSAQELPVQATTQTWQFTNMSGSGAVVVFSQDSARVQKDSANISFAIQRQGKAVRLKDKTINQRVLQILGLDQEAINANYGRDSLNLLPAEQLLTAAYTLPDRKLLLEGTANAQHPYPDQDTAGGTVLAEEEPAVADSNVLTNASPWWYALGALLLGLLLGWFLTPRRKEVTTQTEIKTETFLEPSAEKEWQRRTAQLETSLETGKRELARIKEDDQHYFNAIFEHLLLPLQESLEQNKRGHLLAQMTTATVLLSSITRHKLGKKGKYDDANLNLLAGGPTDTGAPVITGDTPPDQIPHHLRTLIILLQENGITGLGELVVQGYRLKDL